MKVIFVVGPTGAGKSEVALKIAGPLDAAIINCDSIQIYQGLDIGSAKPTLEEMSEVPHFLYSYVEKGQRRTAGEFRRDFFECIEKIEHSFPVVLVVGGAGFYLKAVEKGMYDIGPADPKIVADIEATLKAEGSAQLYQELLDADPVTAKKFSPNDHYRLTRALSILRQSGRPVSEILRELEDKQQKFPFPYIKIGVTDTKERLHQRIEKRTERMLKAGLVSEVQTLINEGFGDWSALDSVGYREARAFLQNGSSDFKELQAQIVQSTMQLIKKQKTWFRKDSEVKWFNPDQVAEVMTLTQQFCKVNR